MISSGEMTRGVIKNGSLLGVLWTLWYFIPEDFVIPMSTLIAAFAIGQFISIFENLGLMGVKLPPVIEEHLKTLQGKDLKDFNDTDGDDKIGKH